ncbi:MAG: CidA/LrgA family protein [Lachnospirales bacterium]
MKYIRELSIIILISFIGEAIHFILPLPVPASIYGLVIMFLCLLFKIIKIESVKTVGNYLLEIMPIMFIPAGVGLMTAFDILKPLIIPYAIITFFTTFFVMGISGKVTQILIDKKEKTND